MSLSPLVAAWLLVAPALAAQSDEPLRVAPAGLEAGVPLGERWLPRGSVVEAAASDCGALQGVTVLRVDPWHRIPEAALAEVGASGCVEPASLARVDTGSAGDALLAPVTAALEQHFGAPDAALSDFVIGRTDWGRVSLPLRYFSAEEVAAQYGPERLMTTKQREKAVVATGPAAADGTPVYLHFLGSDAPRSDVWGEPDMVAGLLALARGWFDHCVEAVSPDAPGRCTLQIGDLSWYGPARPDPLGHRPGHLGRCVDLRLFRDDGSLYEAYWNRQDDREGMAGGYSQAMNLAFLRYALSEHPVSSVYFNDPGVYSVVDGVDALGGHDDHIHLCW